MVDLSNLTRQKVFEETKWLGYFLCSGQGIGSMSPLCLDDTKELCLHSQSGTVELVGDQGCVHSFSTCVCISSHVALPPAKGSPTCAICNKKFGDEKRAAGTQIVGDVFDDDTFFANTFWCIYCFCYGQGVHKPKATGQLVAAQVKQLCCAGTTMLESPMVEGVACSQLGTSLCFWYEMQLPPAKGNPKCAICLWKMNKDHSEASNSPPGKPEQVLVA